MNADVGADLTALCSKCGDVWHVVVAKVGGEIVKVQCKECHALHRYRDARVVAKRKGRPAGARGGRSAGKKSALPAVVSANLEKPIVSYRIGAYFESGDRVSHAKFGLGVVQGSPGPGRIEILFGDGPRLLAQAKPASGYLP